MADWSKLVEGFQRGAEFSQDFRARRQIERARDQALERGDYDLQSTRAFRRIRDPQTEGALGPLDPNSVQDYQGLEDPFAFRLFDWVRTKAKRKKRALQTGAQISSAAAAPAPPQAQTGAMSYALPDTPQAAEAPLPIEDTSDETGYADGGLTEDELVDLNNQQERNARGEIRKEKLRGAGRKAIETAKSADTKAGEFLNVRPKEGQGFLRRAARSAKGAGALAVLAGTAADVAETPTEQYRKRFALETNDPSLAGDIAVRTLGAASDLGNTLTGGVAGKMFYRDLQEPSGEAPAAAPLTSEVGMEDLNSPAGGGAGSVSSVTTGRRPAAVASAPRPKIVDFSDLDTTHQDLPNMQLGDWVKYRAQMLDAARQSGRPEAVQQVNDQVTRMQMQGFHDYGQQGLALQAAGNVHAAMMAYRAAFQYFPNGNDVEFGLHRDRGTGRQQIVGFGKSEESGKVIPGSEIVMDPERVAVLLENFTKPEAWRMWTKDWRDFQQGQRQYQEVTKPLAQAQADYMATNADANVLRAENAALRGGAAGASGAAANMRNAERVFRERVQMLGMTDEAQADFLANVMSQIKAANPNTPDNSIVQAVMKSVRDGTLEQRLAKMGIAPAAAAPATPNAAMSTRRALPVGDDADYAPQSVDDELSDMSPEEREWATRPAE